MTAAPPPKLEFTDAKEAKAALVEVLTELNKPANREGLAAAVAQAVAMAAGDEAKIKMNTMMFCMPKVMQMLAGVPEKYGFAPGQPGIMGAMTAFTKVEDPALKGAIKVVEGAVKGGVLPSEAEIQSAIASVQ